MPISPEINAEDAVSQQLIPRQEQEIKEILNLFKEVESVAKEGYDKSLRLHRTIERDAAQPKI